MSLRNEIANAVIDALYEECEECADLRYSARKNYDDFVQHCTKCEDTGRLPSRFGVELLNFVRKYINRDDI